MFYSGLSAAVQRGWGNGYYTNSLTRRFRENILKFSGAKSYCFAHSLASLKSHVSREVFPEKARKLTALYCEQWQWVEEKFAANAASSARDFQTYQNDIDIYPNLKYRTMGDAQVRPKHAENEGVIKPVHEWTKIPPLDYGCRCWLEQTMEAPNGKDISVFNAKIANNPAFTGEIFTQNNGYFQRIPDSDKQTVRIETEKMKERMPYNRQIKVGENTVFVNDFADLSDLQPNIDAAKTVAGFLKKDVYIRPHINVDGVKNPELGIGEANNLADLKTMAEDSKNFFRNCIRKANKQGCQSVVADISIYSGTAADLQNMIKAGSVRGGKSVSANIKSIVLIRYKTAISLTRKQIEEDMFNELSKLFQ